MTHLVTDEISAKEIAERERFASRTHFLYRLALLNHALDEAPGYYSPYQDEYLRKFALCNEIFSGILFMIQTKFAAGKLNIIPHNTHIEKHREEAKVYREVIYRNSENGAGLRVALDKYIVDVLSCNNGGFLRIVANGRWDEPIMGKTAGVVHMNTLQCIRTGIPEFPVVYESLGKAYPIHHSRVIDLALQPDPDPDLNNVGHSPVWRSLDAVKRLTAIWTYYAEKIGAKPAKGFLIGEGVSEEELSDSIVQYETAAHNMGLSAYSGLIPITSVAGKIDLRILSLADLPEFFSEEKVIQTVAQELAIQFGIDANSIFQIVQYGSTKASSVVSHVRSSGQLYNLLSTHISDEFSRKVLPTYLKAEYDIEDEISRELKINLQANVIKAVTTLLEKGVADKRTAREILMGDGVFTPAQFEQMELNEGRTQSGENLLALLFSDDPMTKELLGFPDVENILDVENNTPEKIKPMVQSKLIDAYRLSINTSVDDKRLKARQAIAVLETLLQMYTFGIPHWTLIDQSNNNIQPQVGGDGLAITGQSGFGVTPKTENTAFAGVKRDDNAKDTLDRDSDGITGE